MRLRPITLDDVDALVALDRDPEVMRYLSGGRPTPRDEVVETIRAHLGCRWIGVHRVTNDFVGWFGLVPTRSAEYAIGYRLRRAVWGCGLATEGARALITLAFTELGHTGSPPRPWPSTSGPAASWSVAACTTSVRSISSGTIRSPAPSSAKSSTSSCATTETRR